MFCLKDVCEVFDLCTQKAVQWLEENVLSKYPIADNLARIPVGMFRQCQGICKEVWSDGQMVSLFLRLFRFGRFNF